MSSSNTVQVTTSSDESHYNEYLDKIRKEIREFEQLSEETQKPLPDYAESGSCNIEFGSPDWT